MVRKKQLKKYGFLFAQLLYSFVLVCATAADLLLASDAQLISSFLVAIAFVSFAQILSGFLISPLVFFSVYLFAVGREWLAQQVRSLPSDHKVPGSIPGFAEIRIFVQSSFPPKLTQLSILSG